jgi:cellulose synthase/poly-beta-1,6-N-acetylglucosamine synthase-like glycosyltransferase
MSNLFVGGGEFKSKATETYGEEVAFSDLKTLVPFDSEVTMMCEFENPSKGRVVSGNFRYRKRCTRRW